MEAGEVEREYRAFKINYGRFQTTHFSTLLYRCDPASRTIKKINTKLVITYLHYYNYAKKLPRAWGLLNVFQAFNYTP